jgi:hypothetical protein
MPFICDRCGFRYEKLRKEWTGLMVCDADYDPKPSDHTPPRLRAEGLPRPNARPEPPEVWWTTVNPEDL